MRHVHVELEVHVAQFSCDVENADHLCLIVLGEGCCGCQVAQGYGIDGVVANQMDICIEGVSVELNERTWLDGQVSEDDVLEIQTVRARIDAVIAKPLESALVIPACCQLGI